MMLGNGVSSEGWELVFPLTHGVQGMDVQYEGVRKVQRLPMLSSREITGIGKVPLSHV